MQECVYRLKGRTPRIPRVIRWQHFFVFVTISHLAVASSVRSSLERTEHKKAMMGCVFKVSAYLFSQVPPERAPWRGPACKALKHQTCQPH